MVSSLLRRSGVAVCLILELMEWRPKHVYQIGVGINHKELDVMRETWGGQGWKLEGFEPHPDIVRMIAAEYPGVLHNLAISDRAGTAILNSKLRHKDGSSLYALGGDDVRHHEVATVTLDSFYPQGPGNDALVWLDCEGSELAAINGGKEFLAGVLAINVEMTSRPCYAGDANTLVVHELLSSLGFLRQWVHTSRVSAGQSDCLYVRRELFRADLCCCPCAIREGGCA